MGQVCKLTYDESVLTILSHIHMTYFQDKSISTSLPVIDLIDTITPRAIREDMVKREDLSPEDMINNAK